MMRVTQAGVEVGVPLTRRCQQEVADAEPEHLALRLIPHKGLADSPPVVAQAGEWDGFVGGRTQDE